jgi:hypothetical protein
MNFSSILQNTSNLSSEMFGVCDPLWTGRKSSVAGRGCLSSSQQNEVRTDLKGQFNDSGDGNDDDDDGDEDKERINVS